MLSIIEKAKAVRLLILDVDGILTNGLLHYGNDGLELKSFHVHDGLGIKLLQKIGISIAVISAKTSEALARRLHELKITHVYLGQKHKRIAYEDLKIKLALSDDEIAYMGDDLPDLPILSRVLLAITVPHSPLVGSEHIDFITKKEGGAGAVREVCELLLRAKDQYESVIQSYLSE